MNTLAARMKSRELIDQRVRGTGTIHRALRLHLMYATSCRGCVLGPLSWTWLSVLIQPVAVTGLVPGFTSKYNRCKFSGYGKRTVSPMIARSGT